MAFEDERFAAAVRECWDAIPDHFPNARVDAFVVMPNHVHGIVWIVADGVQEATAVGAQHAAPLRRPAGGVTSSVQPGSLGAIVRSFKSAATKHINELRATPAAPVWQRNYYERIIRNDDELARIRQYILWNPVKWALDRENPDRIVDIQWEREWEWLEPPAP